MPTNRTRVRRVPSRGDGVTDECLRFFRWDGLIPHYDFPWARGRTPEEITKFYRSHLLEIRRRYREKYGLAFKGWSR